MRGATLAAADNESRLLHCCSKCNSSLVNVRARAAWSDGIFKQLTPVQARIPAKHAKFSYNSGFKLIGNVLASNSKIINGSQ